MGRLTRTGWGTIAVFGGLGVLIALGALVAAPRPYQATGQVVVSAPTHPPDSAVVQRLRAPISTPGTVVVRSLRPHLLVVEATSTRRAAAAVLANQMMSRLVRFIDNETAGHGRLRATIVQPATVPAASIGPSWAWLWVGLAGGLVIGGLISLTRVRLPRQAVG